MLSEAYFTTSAFLIFDNFNWIASHFQEILGIVSTWNGHDGLFLHFCPICFCRENFVKKPRFVLEFLKRELTCFLLTFLF